MAVSLVEAGGGEFSFLSLLSVSLYFLCLLLSLRSLDRPLSSSLFMHFPLSLFISYSFCLTPSPSPSPTFKQFFIPLSLLSLSFSHRSSFTSYRHFGLLLLLFSLSPSPFFLPSVIFRSLLPPFFLLLSLHILLSLLFLLSSLSLFSLVIFHSPISFSRITSHSHPSFCILLFLAFPFPSVFFPSFVFSLNYLFFSLFLSLSSFIFLFFPAPLSFCLRPYLSI